MKREIGWAAEIGCKNIACTMWGVEELDPLKFDEYAARYAAVLEAAKPFGVRPLLELWGHRALHRLGDARPLQTTAARGSCSTSTTCTAAGTHSAPSPSSTLAEWTSST